jgi:chromosome segregation ATPase
MTEQDRILLDEFKIKIKQLIALYEQERGEKQQLLNQVEEFENEIDSLRHDNELLTKKYDNLKLAKSLLVSDGESQEAKNRINRIVREIDKCIAMLNQ